MTISHGTATRYALVNAAVDRVDLGGGSYGKLTFLSATDTVVCNITLANPAFSSTGSSASQTLLGVPLTGTVLTSGTTISKFYVYDTTGSTVVIAGTVSTSGADINLSSITPSTGDQIVIDSITYTAPV